MGPTFGDVVRGIGAVVCLIAALVLFPWSAVQARDESMARMGLLPPEIGERFDKTNAYGATANATELIHEDLRHLKAIGIFGLGVLIAAPLGRRPAPRNAPPI